MKLSLLLGATPLRAHKIVQEKEDILFQAIG